MRRSTRPVPTSNPKFEDFLPEIEAIKADGYEILDHIVLDYGKSLGLWAKKRGRTFKIMFVECFYDTNEKEEKIKWHGVLDIRSSPWSKNIRQHHPAFSAEPWLDKLNARGGFHRIREC